MSFLSTLASSFKKPEFQEGFASIKTTASGVSKRVSDVFGKFIPFSYYTHAQNTGFQE